MKSRLLVTLSLMASIGCYSLLWSASVPPEMARAHERAPERKAGHGAGPSSQADSNDAVEMVQGSESPRLRHRAGHHHHHGSTSAAAHKGSGSPEVKGSSASQKKIKKQPKNK